ncbi:MAG: LuxR C-terminal-related transcriptional regulator [Acidobacteriia bacterium]|nr:LuxR C-terminal-related transcriptional regulator [Terriglobia bacterium]
MPFDQSSNNDIIHVFVADSTRIHTQLLAEALKRDPRLEVISSASDSARLIAMTDFHSVDVVVISSNLDDEPTRGFELLRQLRATYPDIRAILLLDSSKRETILEAFRAGARGIFARHESVEVLSKCIRRVHEGQIWANSEQMSFAVEALASAPTVRAVNADGFDLLSKRELEVVRGLSEGLTNREIAERLGLSQHTIKNYLFRIFDKLGVSSRVELLFMTLSTAGTPQSPLPSSGTHTPYGNDNHATASWYQKAAEQGLPGAQVTLAQMYRDGQGVRKDLVAAYMWYLVSERTCLELKDQVDVAKKTLEDLLAPEQILEAQRRASERVNEPAKPSSRGARSETLSAHQATAGVV